MKVNLIKYTKSSKILDISFIILFLTSVFLAVSSLHVNVKSYEAFPNSRLKSSQGMGRIRINGNQEWLNFKEAGGCTGSGTYIDPYVISGLTIDTYGNYYGIFIQNTIAYFRIEHCTVQNTNGVSLFNVTNGCISYNIINNSDESGISLTNCEDINISENIIDYNGYTGLGSVGVGLTSCLSCVVSGNKLNDNCKGSILLQGQSKYNTITGNKARNNYLGVCLKNSEYNDIYQNTFEYNQLGLVLEENSKHNNVFNNKLQYNSLEGLLVEDSNNNTLYLNNIIYTKIAPTYVISNNSTNFWSSPEKVDYTYNGKNYTNYLGNYFSDYTGIDTDNDGIGNTPYSINSDKDNFPLMGPFENHLIMNITASMAINDIDQDGLTNLQENSHNTDPNNSDTDGDGLSDGQEVNTYLTDPNKPDTDSDGLTDGQEINTYSTDPNDSDSDGDGLSDGQEVNIYFTDPTNPDSDGDGFSDGVEIFWRGDPNDAEKTPLIAIIIVCVVLTSSIIIPIFIIISHKRKKEKREIERLESREIEIKKDLTQIQSLLDEKKFNEYIKKLEEYKKITEKEGFTSLIKEIDSLLLNVKSLIKKEKQKNIRKDLAKIQSLLDENKFIESIKKLEECKRNARIENFSPLIKEIDSLLLNAKSHSKEFKIYKIKKTVLDLGTKFTRLKIIEIAEKCGLTDEQLIIDTVLNMIEKNEIYANYFSISKSIAFNQQANIEEIDRLMAAYKDWEEKKVGKK